MKERAIFDAALALEDPAERDAYLNRQCGGNAKLRQRLVALLAAVPKLDDFLESPPRPSSDFVEWAAKPGDVIGNYKLLQQIGEGGFGIVYMAEQQQPVRRKVALKIVKAGMDSREIISRFEAERQALAMMDHPNIARVLEAGTTTTGRPYFVMDLVRGAPITEFCDDNQLSITERLNLFVPVCRAIQHAHHKGIIHRDIKPSNILITSWDGEPTAKVIDFGVAKAMDHRLTERTLFTRFGQVVGTLEYMSPEQAEMGGMDIDTRSDVYSLGVVLYELLTGSTPLQRSRFKNAAFDEMLRMIREEEPATPSDRISQSGDDLAAISAQRCMEPKKIGAFMRGELDWVVMKALEKRRSRRFATANEFADDIEHFLRGEPVSACPPSMSYRLGKLARKYVGLILATTVLLAVLMVTTPISIWQAIRATQAQRDARNERDQAREARDKARKSQASESQAHIALKNAYELLSAEQLKTSDAHHRALRNEARLATEKGHSLIQQGRIREGVLWLVRALNNLPANEESLRHFIRLNIASVWHEIPQPSIATFELHNANVEPANVEPVNVADVDSEGRFISWLRATKQPPRVWLSGNHGTAAQELHFDWKDITPRGFAFAAGPSLLAVAGTSISRLSLDAAKPPLVEKLIDDRPAIGPVFVNRSTSRVLVFDSDSPRARLIDSVSGRVLATMEAGEDTYFSTASGGDGPFSPEGDVVAIVELPYVRIPALDGAPRLPTLRRMSADTGQLLGDPLPLAITPDPSRPLQYTVGPKGEFVMFAVTDNRTGQTTFREIDSATGKSTDVTLGDASGVGTMAVAPHGLIVAVGNAKTSRFINDLDLWSVVPQRELIGEIALSGQVDQVRFDATGRYLYTLGWTPIVRWTIPESRLCAPLVPQGAPVQLLSISDQGETFQTISGRQVSRWKLTTGEPVLPSVSIPMATSETRVTAAFSRDGNTFMLADGVNLQRWDMRTGQVAGRPISAPYDIARFSVDHSGKRIMCVCAVDDTKSELHVYDSHSGEEIGRPIRFFCAFDWRTGQPVMTQGAVAFSPDGNKILATERMTRLRMWNVSGEDAGNEPMEFGGTLTFARFTPDGRHVLACINNAILELRDSTSGQTVGQPISVNRNLRALAISADSKVLATAVDGEIRLWFLETGQSLGKPIPQSNVTAIGFSRDGKMLLVGDAEGLVRTWRVFDDLPAESMTIAIEAITGMQLTDDGVVTQLEFAPWRERYSAWKKQRESQVLNATASFPRILEAALDARTPEQRRVVQSELNRMADGAQDGLVPLLVARFKGDAQQFEAAAADVKRAVKLGPSHAVKGWLSSFARYELRQNQRDRARWYLDQIVESDLADADVYLALAELHVAEDHRAEANAWLQRAVDAQPTSTAILRSVGEIDFRIGNFESAIARATSALELGGGNAKLWKLRAACYAGLGRWDEAADDLGKAVQRHPGIAELREQLAIALVSAGNLTGYRELCAETMANFDLEHYAKRPWTVPAHLVLAANGLTDYQPIIKPAQDFADLHLDGCVSPHILAPYCYRSGEFRRAAEAKFAANSYVIPRPDVLILFAMANAKVGQIEEAKQKLAEADAMGKRQTNLWEQQRIRLLMSEAEQVLCENTASETKE